MAKFLKTLERFLQIEIASGLLLLLATAAALIWANSPWSGYYERLWHLPVSVGIGSMSLTRSLHFFVDEGLMALFFLVVGLEIRSESHEGSLASWRLAALPIIAALGGIVVPALIYLAFNLSLPTRGGWAVPMATDIAFALGVLSLLGKRIPAAVRVLLLALAIADDIAAVLIITFFYSHGLTLAGALLALGGLGGVALFQWLGVRTALPYVLPGAVVWWGLLEAGIHPAVAGVILGLVTPVAIPGGRNGPLLTARRALLEFRRGVRARDHDLRGLLPPVQRLKNAQRDLLPPAVRVQAALHPWVAFAIMPLFALANAGVRFDALRIDDPASLALLGGIVIGLVVGKPLGIVLSAAIGVKARLCALPAGVRWRDVWVMGCLGGIGFTMSIFIATLAFTAPPVLATARFAVVTASSLAALTGLGVGWLVYRKS